MKPQLGHHPWRKVFQHDIAHAHQVQEELFALRLAEVNQETFLVDIERVEARAAILALMAFDHRRCNARRVETRLILDLNNLGAHHRQELAAVWTGHHPA